MAQFNELGLSQEILRAIEEMGFETPSDIQAQAIPLILEGRDVLGRSNTGTGKTAAFGLPAIESIDPNLREPQVLVLSPTRELDIQIATELRKFSKYKEGVKIVPIYGGQSIDQQIKLLKRGCGIVVGTPGRVMDHLRRRTLRFDSIKMVVLDEADEMLNMGFKEDIEDILSNMPENRSFQMTLFSATMPAAIMDIAAQFQENPALVEIKSAQRTIDTVEQTYYECGRGKKTDALRILMNTLKPNLTMIFCNTKKMVDELMDELNKYNMKAIGLHGDMKQQSRTRVMEQFRTGNYPILIATDVAARGIDVDDIDLVVNYDIPQDNEYYIHRVGRTGRAGKSGKAITLISGKGQMRDLKAIMKYTKTNIMHRTLPTSEELLEASRLAFIEHVKEACTEISEESIEIANELLGQGIAIENLISAMISMTYKPQIIDAGVSDTRSKEKKSFDFPCDTLHFNIGKSMQVTPSHIVAAISEYCDGNSDMIGRIQVKSKYSLVDIDKNSSAMVLERMSLCKIRGFEVNVKLDERPEEEDRPKRSRSRKSDEGSSSRRSSRSRREESEEKETRRRSSRSSRSKDDSKKESRSRRSSSDKKSSSRSRSGEKSSRRRSRSRG